MVGNEVCMHLLRSTDFVLPLKVTDYFRITTTLETCAREINRWKYRARAKTRQKKKKQSSNKMKNFMFQPAKTLVFTLELYIFLHLIW